jgi:hypothetical protein
MPTTTWIVIGVFSVIALAIVIIPSRKAFTFLIRSLLQGKMPVITVSDSEGRIQCPKCSVWIEPTKLEDGQTQFRCTNCK